MRASRVILALGVVLAGLCAALPFRHSLPSIATPRERPAPLLLTLRRPDTPLELAPRLEPSPAVGFPQHAGRQSPESQASLSPATPPSDLANLVPPPALPVSFQPTTVTSEPNPWRPDPLTRPSPPPSKPRSYRLRDGDTLEKLAERFLGNSQRASDIFELNRGVLSRPDLLPVGVTIMLPPRETSSDLEPVTTNPLTTVGPYPF